MQSSKMQKVYIVVPMYNAKKYIDCAVNSALAQKQIDVTLVLVDHGSSDGTYDYVKEKYGKRENIVIIGLQRNKNEIRSASRPLNEGFKYVAQNAPENAWVMRLDADDVLYDEATLESVIGCFEKGVLLLSGSMVFVNTDDRTAQEYCQRREYDSLKALRREAAYAYPHHATLISVKLINRILERDGYGYFEKIGYGEDLDFSLRMFAVCKESQIRFSHVIMIIKELSGDTITNSVQFINLMHDHFSIFYRNKSFSRLLLLKIVLWYVIDNMGKWGKKLNKTFTPPAAKYAVSCSMDYEVVCARKEMWNVNIIEENERIFTVK